MVFILIVVLNLQEERQAWLQYQKKKWALQAEARAARRSVVEKRARIDSGDGPPISRPSGFGRGSAATLGGFLRRTQRTLLDTPWQIVQVNTAPKLFELVCVFILSLLTYFLFSDCRNKSTRDPETLGASGT